MGRKDREREGERKETYMCSVDCEKSKSEEKRRPAAGSPCVVHIDRLSLCSLADAQGLQALPGSADNPLETGSHLGSTNLCSSLEPWL